MANPRPPAWNDKVAAGQLLNRVKRHANGEIEMTKTQLEAARIFLKKVIPDLNSTTIKGDAEAPLKAEISVTFGGNDKR